MMAQTTHFFVGANSGEGFRNLFPELVDVEDTYDLMVLKGGPGVGKNTFMREIGRTMEEAGAAVEYLWCSGDPDSLDGVVIPELRCAVADGTPPHGSVSKGRRTSPEAAGGTRGRARRSGAARSRLPKGGSASASEQQERPAATSIAAGRFADKRDAWPVPCPGGRPHSSCWARVRMPVIPT